MEPGSGSGLGFLGSEHQKKKSQILNQTLSRTESGSFPKENPNRTFTFLKLWSTNTEKKNRFKREHWSGSDPKENTVPDPTKYPGPQSCRKQRFVLIPLCSPFLMKSGITRLQECLPKDFIQEWGGGRNASQEILEWG